MTTTIAERDERATGDGFAERAANSKWLERLARAGLVSRGVLYGLIGVLALKVAAGSRGENADKQGALTSLAHQPFGKVLLAAVAVGFAGYALWRFADAVLDTDGEGTDLSGWAKRAADLGRGILYASFCVAAGRLITGSSGEDQTEEADLTAKVLGAPLGRVVVGLVGVAILAAGLWNGYRAISGKYKEKLQTWQMGDAVRRWVTPVATVGLFARMVVFLLIGVFLLKAAVRYDAQEAVGVDGALHRLVDRPYGPLLLAIVAVGLFTFGLFSLVEARYRRVLDDPAS